MEPIVDRAKRKHLTPEEDPFCHWFIMEREAAFDDEHGPKRFSLLFLCCEGVTAYVRMYCHNEIAPTVLAIIQPGTGFGGNWSDFRDCYGALAYVIGHTPQGMPRWIFNGGTGYSDEAYSHLPWYDYEYEIVDKVANYYGSGDGQMVIFKRENERRTIKTYLFQKKSYSFSNGICSCHQRPSPIHCSLHSRTNSFSAQFVFRKERRESPTIPWI